MHFPIDNSLDTRILGRIYENTTSTYKFYLFVSILDILVLEKRRKISFWELIAGMIAEAWDPIHYFRLSFGHWDTLYKSVIELQKILNIPVSYSKKNVKSVLLLHENNSNVKKIINIFTKNVPYRFLSPWIRYHSNSQVIEESKKLQNNCLYSIKVT